MTRHRGIRAALMLLAFVAVSCGAPATVSATRPVTATAPTAGGDPADALAGLGSLIVKPWDPDTGYSRDEFGTPWFDVDRNGCGTRDDVLGDTLFSPTFQTGGTCIVLTGTLHDPYTGRTITFHRGVCAGVPAAPVPCSSDVQIDHVVALKNVWRTGGQRLTPEQRLQIANDPLNLIATDGATNAAKGARDPSEWLPPNQAFWCAYVERVVDVKEAFGLWVDQAEHDKIAEVLRTCPASSEVTAP